MNLTHLHLVVTHLPIYGSILGSLVLLYGIFAKNHTTKLAAYYVLIISAIGGIVAFSTGEAAEESVEGIQGIAKNLIEDHEEFAELTLISIIAMGVMSLAAIYVTLRIPSYAMEISVAVLVFSVICFCMTAWTGYLGGQIRHTELNSVSFFLQEHSKYGLSFQHNVNAPVNTFYITGNNPSADRSIFDGE